MTRRRAVLTVGAAAVLALLPVACSSGPAAPTGPPRPPSSIQGSTSPSPTGSGRGSGSASPTVPPTTVTTAPGDSIPSIPGAPTLDSLLSQAATLVPDGTKGDPFTLANGAVATPFTAFDATTGVEHGLQIYTAPTSGNLVQLNCGSSAPPAGPDAVRQVCLDIAHPGADRAAATAWVAQSLAALGPTADSTTPGISNLDLAGLEWKVYRAPAVPGLGANGFLWVTVAAKGILLPNVAGS